jgi:hypothetical protein
MIFVIIGSIDFATSQSLNWWMRFIHKVVRLVANVAEGLINQTEPELQLSWGPHAAAALTWVLAVVCEDPCVEHRTSIEATESQVPKLAGWVSTIRD